MATKTTGTMASVNQAISARKHHVSLPPGTASHLGRTVVRMTQVHQTETGQGADAAIMTSNASGIPVAIAQKAVTQSFETLKKNGTISQATDILNSQGIKLQRDALQIDIMDERHVGSLLADIDKCAANRNISGLSRKSTTELKKLLAQYGPSDDMHLLIKNTIDIKEHADNLSRLRVAKIKQSRAFIRTLRKYTKDCDVLEGGITVYDTADQVKRTVSTVKRIQGKLKAYKALRAASAAKVGTHAGGAAAAGATASGGGAAAAGATASGGAAAAAGTSAGGAATAGSTVSGGAVAASGTAAGAAGGVSVIVIFWGVVAVLLVITMVLVVISAISGAAPQIPTFSILEDGSDYDPDKDTIYDTQAGSIYLKLQERDATFVDMINNYSKNHSVASVCGKSVYGSWSNEKGCNIELTLWTNTTITWKNGDGVDLGSVSSAKEILSAATVFTIEDAGRIPKTYELYALKLWEDSHNFVTSTSDIYFCEDGCAHEQYHCNDSSFYSNIAKMAIIGNSVVDYSASGCSKCALSYCSGCQTIYCDGYHYGKACAGHLICPGHLTLEGKECESCSYQYKPYWFRCSGCEPSSLAGADDTVYECPEGGSHIAFANEPVCSGHCSGHSVPLCTGHIDLYIDVTVNKATDKTNSLFDVDSVGKITGENLSVSYLIPETYTWYGWSEDYKEWVLMMSQTNWYELYGLGDPEYTDYFYASVSDDVLKYESLISQYAAEHGIPEYTNLIMAVMMQESGGRGTDPMQASECSYNTMYPNTPNGITDPEYSISVGIQYLADCLDQAGAESPSDTERVKLALQGYNYGTGYITWALSNYGGYTLENASEFSDIMAAKMGWSGYGDKQYVPHVLRYYTLYRGDQSIVEVALSQVGNQGGAPYWSWYGYDSRVEWCACFVSWCANQCGYIDAGCIPKFAYCPAGANWFKDSGQWQNRNYEPKAGDIIFFDWEGDGVTDHVGIVSKTEGGVVYTVEGNSGDACKQKQYAVGSGCIYGYGTPAYPQEE